ncbi:hypothetical protein ACHAWF_000679, partial [Thalassiosira exigua]
LAAAVLGGGAVGSTLAHKLEESRRFQSVAIAARDPDETRAAVLAKGIDVRVGPASEVLSSADVVILAIRGVYDDGDVDRLCEALSESLGEAEDVVVIDATNPLGAFADGLPVRTWEGGTSGGEKLQRRLPKAKVYKAFNTIGVEHMEDAAGKVMLFAGDPEPAFRSVAEEVIRAVGFKPFYVGPIRYARNLEAMAELWIHMAIPDLGGRDAGRNFWFSVDGDPREG